LSRTPQSNNVSDYVNKEQLLLRTDDRKYVWCKRKKLARMSPDFDTEEEAVQWIQKPEVLRNEKEKVNPLVKKMKEIYYASDE
jgi:hypothetical protein